jgi:hypothetical protein
VLKTYIHATPATLDVYRYDMLKPIHTHATRATLDLDVYRYHVFKPYTIMRHERHSISMYTDTMCSNHTHSCDTSDSRCIQIRCVLTIHTHATRATLDLDVYRYDVLKPFTLMRHERLSTSMYTDTMCSNHTHSCDTSDSRPRSIQIRCVQIIHNHATRATLDLDLYTYDVVKPYTLMRHERLSTSMYTDTMCSNHTHSCDTSDSRPRCIQIRCAQTIQTHATQATLDLDVYRYDVVKPYTLMRHERLSTSMYTDTMCSKYTHSWDTSDSRPRCIQIRCAQTIQTHATRATLDLHV